MQRIFRILLIFSALETGALAQIVVAPPPPPITPTRTVTPLIRFNTNATAIVLEAQGTCKYSTNGTEFHNLKPGAELPEHIIVHTGSGAVELFLRRMGACVRLQPNTDIVVDRTVQKVKDQNELNTSVEVRKGSILAVVQAEVAGSRLTIKNAAGNTVTLAKIGSRYKITADSIKEGASEKLASENKGEAGRKLAAMVKEQVELDEVQGLAETSDDSNPGLEP
jgi:hypothetical protein